VPYYLQLLESKEEDDDEAFDEEAFVKNASRKEAPGNLSRESAAKQVLYSIHEALRLFAIINGGESADLAGHATILRAAHHHLFTVLYHAGLGRRTLLESAFSFDDHDDVQEYVAYVRKKHRLSEDQVYTLGLTWVDGDSDLGFHVLERDWRLTVFSGELVGFLVRDEKDQSMLRPSPVLCTDNGVVLSKYYFFMRLLTILRHLQLATRMVAKEKGQTLDPEELELLEIFEMEAFHAAADEFFERRGTI
jgi:hypothetical protein